MNFIVFLILSNISIISSFTPPSCGHRGSMSSHTTSTPIMNHCDTTKLHAAAKSAKSSKSSKSAKSSKSSKSSKTAKAKAAKVVEEKPVTVLKSEFISSLSEKTGLSKTDSQAALAAVLDIIQEEVAAGKRINMLGFGTFKLSRRSARKGRNPRTGEEIEIKESFSPSFSASKSFKERVNPDR